MDLDDDTKWDVGEFAGKINRRYDSGVNVNNLPGNHYEGSPADFIGEGVDPHA